MIIIRRGDLYYSLSTTAPIHPGDWYLSKFANNALASDPIRCSNAPPGWSETMLEGGIYLKIVHTTDPKINL